MAKPINKNSIFRIDEITALFYTCYLNGQNQQARQIAQQSEQQIPNHPITKIFSALTQNTQPQNPRSKTENIARQTIDILLPNNPPQQQKYMFGQILFQLLIKGEQNLAQHLYEKCPENIKKNNPYIAQYQARLHMNQWQHQQSLDILETIPNHQRNAEIWEQMALCARITGQQKKMDEYFAHALKHDPKNYDITARWGLAKIFMGDMQQGWKLYAIRKKTHYPDFHIPSDKPEWNGRPFPGETLLLYQELGYGDVIQFARYFKRIHEAAQPNGTIIFACQKPIQTLIQHAFSHYFNTIIPLDNTTPIPEHHIHASTYELPAILDQTLEKSAITKPYLKITPKKINAPKNKNTCGIIWHTSLKKAPQRIYKIIDPTYLSVLKKAENIHFFSLQFEQEHIIQNNPNLHFIDTSLQPWSMDFLDLARTIASLDALITIDTAAAHIAGAMFKPVIVPIPYDYIADWRWQKINYKPSTYPTMTLIRHQKIDDWDNVMHKITEHIRNPQFFRTNSQ